MKILLLNDNPVVNKLVTLSAQKTLDELDISSSIDAISSLTYDLVVVDDGIGSEDVLDELKEKVNFSKSLYICARDVKELEGFDSTLKKPFLPTDLVELFAMFSKEISNYDSQAFEDISDNEPEEEIALPESKHNEIENLDDLNELEELDDISLDEQLELDEGLLDLDTTGNDDLTFDDHEDLSLEDSQELLLDDEGLYDEELGESILDDEEAQKVKDLLDETSNDASEEDFDFDMSLDLEDEDELEDIIDKDMTEELAKDDDEIAELEDFGELEEVEELEELDELEGDSVDELEDIIDKDVTEELAHDDDLEELEDDSIDDLEDIELQIQNAVDNLTEEDLESEIDEDTLLDIATNEIDSLDKLTSHDMKQALGEELEETEDFEENISDENLENIMDESLCEVEVSETKPEGIEALKKLLIALSDKDVAASMKGMKITVSIELGDA